jgi:hypothetical protein
MGRALARSGAVRLHAIFASALQIRARSGGCYVWLFLSLLDERPRSTSLTIKALRFDYDEEVKRDALLTSPGAERRKAA